MDVWDARYVIAGSIGISLVITLVYIKFLDKAAYTIAWFSVVLLAFSLFAMGFYVWSYRKHDKLKVDKKDDDNIYNDWVAWVAIAFWVIGGLYVLACICWWSSLKVSISIIETAADFVADTKRIILVPTVFFIIMIVTALIWFSAILCVHSIGEISVVDVRTQDKEVIHDNQTTYMIWYMWFGIFWLIAFWVCMNEFVIIVSTCTWYFSRKDLEDDDGIPGDADVNKGFKWAF